MKIPLENGINRRQQRLNHVVQEMAEADGGEHGIGSLFPRWRRDWNRTHSFRILADAWLPPSAFDESGRLREKMQPPSPDSPPPDRGGRQPLRDYPVRGSP